jgi:YVTN family beta-propeller protein
VGVVSVIATAANTVIATIPVGTAPTGVAVTPDGSKVYVANGDSNRVSVIDAAPVLQSVTARVSRRSPSNLAGLMALPRH